MSQYELRLTGNEWFKKKWFEKINDNTIQNQKIKITYLH